MTEADSEGAQLVAAIRDFQASVNDLRRIQSGRTNTNESNFHFNAGGVGVWAAVTACMVMLAMNVFLAAMLFDHSRRLDDMKDYLNAIYMMAPHLKPPEK